MSCWDPPVLSFGKMQSALSRRGLGEEGTDQQGPNTDHVKQTTETGLTPPEAPRGALNTRPLTSYLEGQGLQATQTFQQGDYLSSGNLRALFSRWLSGWGCLILQGIKI